MEMNGWVKLHRQIVDWGWYSDPNTKAVFLHLLLTANLEDKEYLGHKISKGSTVIGLYSLSEKLGLSVRQVRTALDKLERTGEITRKATNKFTVVTVENWSLYQCDARDTDKRATNGNDGFHANNTELRQTEMGIFTESTQLSDKQMTSACHCNNCATGFQPVVDDKQMTNERQTDDKQMTNERQTSDNTLRIKEYKNKEYKNIYGTCQNVKLSDTEYEKLKERFPSDYQDRIDRLSEYIASKGKKYKSHYATILSWARRDEDDTKRTSGATGTEKTTGARDKTDRGKDRQSIIDKYNEPEYEKFFNSN